MGQGKKQKLGNYICKVGDYDVRQLLILPRKQKTFQGKVMMTPGSIEGRVYKGKKLIEGKLKSAADAVKKAYELVCEEGKEKHLPKNLISKYKLQS
jgi:hypothetical protein